MSSERGAKGRIWEELGWQGAESSLGAGWLGEDEGGCLGKRLTGDLRPRQRSAAWECEACDPVSEVMGGGRIRLRIKEDKRGKE